MNDKGQWGENAQDTGVTPLLFTRSAMGFFMTTESQDLGLTSHPKDMYHNLKVDSFRVILKGLVLYKKNGENNYQSDYRS